MRGVFAILGALVLSLFFAPTEIRALFKRRETQAPKLGHADLLENNGSDTMSLKATEWYMKTAVAMIKGARPYLEDTCVLTAAVPGAPNARIQAVFDGHGGAFAAQFLATHLQEVLTAASPFTAGSLEAACEELERRLMHSLNPSGTTATIVIIERLTHPEEVIVQGREIIPSTLTAFKTIHELDTPLGKILPRQKIVIGNKRWPFKLHVVNVGDSRALLLNQRLYAPLTRDHRPDDPAEQARIEAAGAEVKMDRGTPRVRGLAMSRSFGDSDRKRGPGPHPITAKPDIRQFFASANDVLLLHTDGLDFGGADWDLVADEVRESLRRSDGIRNMVTRLVMDAHRGGSKDNITALMTFFSKHLQEQPTAKLRILRKRQKNNRSKKLLPLEEDWTDKLLHGPAGGFSLPMF
uniref:protein-serine/threonine phosphatase n=1 Tax=Neospora caninum (strain Liverpool) TaxID=572307 RepID=A0A0F7U9I3_NEOCL|nr:TPA: Probable protein phosphatase 2C 2 [Neospora caninum Liverpool]